MLVTLARLFVCFECAFTSAILIGFRILTLNCESENKAKECNMNRYRVIIEWEAAYEDPITLNDGEELWLSGKTDEWDGHLWVWAKNQRGKEGWIPDALVRHVSDKRYANAAFSALELTCNIGDELIALNKRHGWILCRAGDGSEGWVPSRNLNLI